MPSIQLTKSQKVEAFRWLNELSARLGLSPDEQFETVWQKSPMEPRDLILEATFGGRAFLQVFGWQGGRKIK